MDKFRQVRGPAAALLQPNIDTDVIVRIERLGTIARDQLGEYAFESLRYDGERRPVPGFPFNQQAFAHAPILLAGRNFGCGSSREGAVWALAGLGVRCVLAPGFGDIFFNNCFQNGALPIRLGQEEIDLLARQCADGAHLLIDLEAQRIVAPHGQAIAFEVDPRRREALLEGLDDIEQTLRQDTAIRAWQQQDRQERPWVWL